MTLRVPSFGISRGITFGGFAATWAGKTSAQTSGRCRKCLKTSAVYADTYLDIGMKAVSTVTSTVAGTAVTA